jgi:phage gp46-like protein
MDFKTVIDGGLRLDWSVSGGQLVTDSGLETAVLISLFTDRRVSDTSEGDSRGWWGDSYPDIQGDQIGSRLWQLAREKQTTALLKARQYALEALQWMVTDGLVSRVNVNASVASQNALFLDISLQRSTGKLQQLRFKAFWGGV